MLVGKYLCPEHDEPRQKNSISNHFARKMPLKPHLLSGSRGTDQSTHSADASNSSYQASLVLAQNVHNHLAILYYHVHWSWTCVPSTTSLYFLVHLYFWFLFRFRFLFFVGSCLCYFRELIYFSNLRIPPGGSPNGRGGGGLPT